MPRYFGCITAFAEDAPAAAISRLREHAIDTLAGADANELIVKPSLGVYGRGVLALRREHGQYRDADGVLHKACDLPEWLGTLGEYDRFVVQERVPSHPALETLSGTLNLQTVRMATLCRIELKRSTNTLRNRATRVPSLTSATQQAPPAFGMRYVSRKNAPRSGR